jgi:PIN domain nuclease of toxin-antitoxin system
MSEQVVVLDACAVIALQRGEEGADQVKARLADPQVEVIVHAINLCEVYYDAVRRDSSVQLGDLWNDLQSLGITVEMQFPRDVVERAGKLKAHWRRISLADCVALALAEWRGGRLLTTDHHELDPLLAAGHAIVFIR